jgi:hypothetical protein
MSYARSRVVPVAVFTLLGGLALATPPLLGVHTVPVPRGPEVAYDLDDYAAALDLAVTSSGTVDYRRLREAPDRLLAFVEALATHGPRSTPDRFATPPEKLAYYINAYNALVLYAVLVHRPESSVHEVHGVIEPVAGFGFFWAQRFRLDGERTNLYDLENDVIRELGDARVHAAINCASRSCPPLRPEPFRASDLESALDDATRAWVRSPKGVRVEDGAIVLNAIFDWYAEDFRTHAEALGAGDGVLDWIGRYLEGEKARAFAAARRAGGEVRFAPYDWGLNRAGAAR